MALPGCSSGPSAARWAMMGAMDDLISSNAALPPARLLVVDDEQAIADLVTSIFRAEGMEATACYSGAEALHALRESAFDLAILDIMMPGMDGFELCGQVRAISDMPVVFLSAKDEEADLVVGFALGADDYVTKPFKPRELVARVRARLRRAQRAVEGAPARSVLEACGIEMDVEAHTATVHDVPLALTPKEYSLLALLLGRGGNPVPTSELYERVWDEPYDSAASNTVMVHIRHLRQKLAAVDSSTEFIQTVWGVGYRVGGGPAAAIAPISGEGRGAAEGAAARDGGAPAEAPAEAPARGTAR